MKLSVLIAVAASLLLGACSSREVTKETVIQPVPRGAVVVPGPQGPPGPPGPPGDTTIVVPPASSDRTTDY